ncbi:MAG TPA: hypothetical protein VFN79_10835 [Steroidobacteraceae bacterium]|nr:hypothetical protein [Steroidobacteraceae bacterium]
MATSQKAPARPRLVAITSAAVALALASGAQAGELAFGPLQQVNLKKSTIVVLGQTFHVSPTALVSSRASYPAAVSLGSISPGTLVWVNGTETANGKSHVQSVIASAQLDVPGATQLFVTGVISAVSDVGQVRVGKLTVDINQTLTADGALPALGSLVSLSGTQPVLNGIFLATSAARIPAVSAGIGGTGASVGIGGTGASAGIGGTGASAGIGGTGASAGIGGTGASAGIGGTGTSVGIGGTGASVGIGGTGASVGIGGTGASAGIGGTGTSVGIGGTGASVGIGGTG